MAAVDLPLIMTTAGAIPTPPAVLQGQLLSLVASQTPGYTANLPASMIEDISSTDVGALVLIDSARVELVNSFSPFGANPFILQQLGELLGVPQGIGSNTAVYVVFTGTVGFVVPPGFVVSDGTFQYIVQSGGIIQSGGSTIPLYAVAINTGTWPVPPNSVTILSTSVPSGITLSVTNPQTGIPSVGPQDITDYRTQVLQANLAASMGMGRYLKTLLGNVTGVEDRLVAVRQQLSGGWEIIVGGGDPYAVAYAIWQAIFDVSTLTGSVLLATNFTAANPGVVTTNLNHGFITGASVTVTGASPTAYNNGGTPYTITVIDEKTFSVGVNTTGFGSYVASSGTITPNARNTSVTINDYPDNYTIPFVLPPAQTVTMTVTWNTTSTNAVSAASVASLGSQALAQYINSIPVGAPINLFELQAVFQEAVASILPTPLLTRMVFAVDINGVLTNPTSGTGIIAGDPESYFTTSPSSITINQG